MTVREFNGTTDRLVTSVGAASGMTYGTFAAIVKFSDLSTFRGISYAHDSGGAYKGAFGTTNFSTFSLNDGSNDSNLGAAALVTNTWYLVVARKASGAGITPRFSVYNFTSGVWIHGNGSGPLNDFPAPGVGGNHQFAFQDGAASVFAGRVAARAHWSNNLPWSSDSMGDAAIEAAGLESSADAWLATTPSTFHLFNQASASTPVPDLSLTGSADQISIVGTAPVTGDDPGTFDFTVTPHTPLLEWSFDEASGAVVDHSGNGRDLTLSGNTVRTSSGGGHTDRALTQIAAEAGPGVSLTGLQTTSRTWMAWVKVTASFNGWFIEFYRSTDDTGVWGLLYLSGSLNFRAKDSSNTVYQSAGIPPDTGNWHHIAATHDGANLRLYRDGVLFSTTAMAVPVWSATSMRVLDGVGSAGFMDDSRLFDVALTESEIQHWMNTPAGAAPTDEATLDATFSALSGAFNATATAEVTVGGTFAAPTADVSSNADASGQIVGSFASPVDDLSGSASADVSMIGTFTQPMFSALGGVPVPDRDIIFTIEPGTRPGNSIEVFPSRTTVEEVATQRTEIGAGLMDSQWRNGSKQFIDFVVKLTDPEGELTLSEVQAVDFLIAVTTTGTTPAPDAADWIAPSVPKVVAADGASFNVTIRHMYQAAATGLHYVWVKFGPTPEEPIYEAATFVVL
jgi:hypothetical protein